MLGPAEPPRGDMDWLLRTTNQMVRCRDVTALLDLAYDAIRDGLGYDRVGLVLSQYERDVYVGYIGTDEHGAKYYPTKNTIPMNAGNRYDEATRDPRLGADGPGFILYDDYPNAPMPDDGDHTDGMPPQLLFVSLRVSDAILGFISVDNLVSGRSITMDDAPPLVAFGNALAVALENMYLLEGRARRIESLDADLHRRVAELEWLRDVSRQVNAADTLDEVLDVVYDGIRLGLGYDRVGIHLFDHAGGVCIEVRGTDEKGHKTCPTDRTLSLAPDSLIWQIADMAALLRGAEYYYTTDSFGEIPTELQYLCDGTPTESVAVPLRSGDVVTGMIVVDNLVSGRAIGPNDAGPLLALANQVATAIENALLRECERAERARLEVLLDSARALNSTLDRESMLQALVSRLVGALDATSAIFSCTDFTARIITSLLQYSKPGSPPVFESPDSCESLDLYPVLENALRLRQATYSRVDDPGLAASERAYLRRHGFTAGLIVPIVIRGEATSALEVYWEHAVALTSENMALCSAIAEQAAVALENARLYADAAARAERDALTGLHNHRALLHQIDHAIAAAEPFALLLVDVDNFKLFNDTYGHPTGDAVLTQIARALHDACRDGDVAGRYGGDEFALLLRGTGPAEADRVARRLAAAVRGQPYRSAEGAIIPLSLSIGAACYPADGAGRPALLALADQAMYAAKRGGAPRPRCAADLLGDSPVGVLDGLVNAVDAKDRYTREHSEDVTQLALLLAEALDLPPAQRRVLAVAGPLHDVGKIAVPDRILRKPGRLTDEEYGVIKRHVAYGVAIIRGVLEDAAVVEAVASHHERWDGRGYPAGLQGPDTPLVGRIMQLADAVSAMMMDRPYRQGMSWAAVVNELRAGAGTQFDPTLVEVFIAATTDERPAVAS